MGHRRLLSQTLAASVLLHLGLIQVLPRLAARPPQRPPETRVELTLVPDPERGGTLVETPESARVPEPPPAAVNPAEHSARAQNPEPAPEVDGRPRAEGDLELFDFRPSSLVSDQARRRRAAAAAQAARAATAAATTEPPSPRPGDESGGDGEILAGAGEVALLQGEPGADGRSGPGGGASDPGGGAPAGGEPRLRHDSPVSGARATGELSLSTYAWAWAPYLGLLRDAIDQRWQPPLAFFMGLIEGDGAVQFRVERDGTVSRLALARENGHPSLARAARAAVEHAAPFPPLPPGFPDPHLDVTWHYRYVLLRR